MVLIMPLKQDQRQQLEDMIMDLHFTADRYIKSEKEIHERVLQVNVEEAIELLKSLSEDIEDDPKKYDYKLHLLIPFQIYELITNRQREQE